MLCKLISVRLRGLIGKASGKGGKWTRILILAVLGFGAVSIGATFYLLFSEFAGAMHGTQLAWFYFAMVGLMSFGISFFFTAFAAKSELFEAKDNEMLLALPLKPRTILLSRLSVLLLSEYLFSFLIMIPAGIAWGITDGLGFLPLYILGSIFLPLLTAGLASIVGWLLALLTANVRRKNLLTVIFSLAFMAAYMYVYSNLSEYINQILTMYQSFSKSIVGWGFLFHWFGLGIAEGDILRLIAAAAISAGVFVLAIWAISHGFLRISGRGTSHGRKAIRYDGGSVEKALYMREMKHLLASPVYMLNCGIGVVMIVILAGLMLIKADMLQGLITMLPMSEKSIELLCSLLMCLLPAMCCFTAASVSLEGKQLWIIRSAPLDAQKILNAKLFFHLSLTIPSILILSIACGIVFASDASSWAMFLLLPQLMNVLCAQFGLIMNLRFPKFNWTNENEPVKQSLSVFLAMMLPALLPIAMAAVVVFVMPDAKLFSLAAIVLLTLLNTLCAAWLSTRGIERFDRLV